MRKTSWAFAAIDQEGHSYEAGDTADFETSSAIKSPIGMVALDLAGKLGIDPDVYTLQLDVESVGSNGSGLLKHEMLEGSNLVRTLTELLELNIAKSDCVATNALIRFIGSKDSVNRAFESAGLPGIELVTDRINFQDSGRDVADFRVGRSTPLALARYHRLFAERSAIEPMMKNYAAMHKRARICRMFGLMRFDLPADLCWTNKTGSMFDITNGSRELIVDAGTLSGNRRQVQLAAMYRSQSSCGGGGGERAACLDFASRNVSHAEELGLIDESAISPFRSKIRL